MGARIFTSLSATPFAPPLAAISCALAIASEAAACAQRAGVDAQVLVDVLAKGGGGSVALERLKPYLLARDGSSLRFAMSNAVKDIGYYRTMAHDSGAVSAIAEAVLRDYEAGLAAGGEQAAAVELASLLAAQPRSG